MKLIIDANILFSALIKHGATIEILFDKNFELYTPDFIIEELKKYEVLISKKTSHSKEEIINLLHSLHRIINVVSENEYYNYSELAKKLSPDINDYPYFALSLKLRCALWSDDKKLKIQDKIKVYSTSEILRLV